jgi:hypothetical protein
MSDGTIDDITLDFKLEKKCFPRIRELADGGELGHDDDFNEIISFINARLDCSDFRMVSVLRTMYRWPDRLPKEVRRKARESILGFKYWMDEPGDDSMCYWSENHQILFAACEYLAGQLYPDEIFANDRRSGAEKRERGRTRVLRWLAQRFRFGFTEWHSNVYYEEDIPPLTILIDFAEDPEIVEKSKMILDLLLIDMGMHSWKGLFGATSGRCYEDQKFHPLKQDTLDIAEKVWGYGHRSEPDWQKISANFLLCEGYQIPPVIREIGRDQSEVIIRDSMGLNLSEIPDHFPDSRSIEETGMFLWAMEAFTNPQSISLTMKIFREWKLRSNRFLGDFAALDLPVLRIPGLYPMVSRILKPSTDGIAIQRSNSYTWKCPGAMLSTSQNYQPGSFGDQQHIWQATLSERLTVFATHPAGPMFDDNARNFSPSYWVGNGIHPHGVQERNVHMSIYRLGGRRGYLEGTRRRYTHARFPGELFDEYDIQGRYAFGNLGGVYIALIGASELEPRAISRADASSPDGGAPAELIQHGMNQYWICEISASGAHEDLAAFMDDILTRPLEFNGRRLAYRGPDSSLELIYRGAFRIDGRVQDLEYPRLDSPYGRAERYPSRMDFHYQNHSLELDFENLKRSWT